MTKPDKSELILGQSHQYEKLAKAYKVASESIRQNSKSFYLASAVLPKAQQMALHALYGFCRFTDNIVDEPHAGSNNNLHWWQFEVSHPWTEQTRDILIAWAHAREIYGVSSVYGNELIEGCELDLTRTRYETFAELERYCYCVASTVGLMAIPIIGLHQGVTLEQARPYAIKLGIALQMTNILRDVGEDVLRGRIYLPLEDMAHFGVSEQSIIEGRLDSAMINLLKFEIDRTYQLYREAWAGIRMLTPRGQFAIALAADIYRGILGKIILNGYNVFTQRAFLSRREKLWRLPVIWLRGASMSH